MVEQKLLQVLQQLKEDFKTLELMFNQGIDKIHGILRETRKDPEDSPIKATFGSDMESPMLTHPKFEGVEPETDSRPLEEDIKLPDSIKATEPVRIQEATIEAIPLSPKVPDSHLLNQSLTRIHTHHQLPHLIPALT
ncbi:hypothetical protein Dsin_005296 [Dipteronia sinensis]|uniref:Uncharacterized protein n=1 Tax=Dipteronia sinensis TaxID=43782 RepID=A0AAE0AXI3_9ROSI|nr:hypothetical protein Dsin_005296 [Dipteronia sinensis]